MLTSKQRAYLRGLANTLETILLAEKCGADVVQVIGSKFVLYRPDPDEPVIKLPKAKK